MYVQQPSTDSLTAQHTRLLLLIEGVVAEYEEWHRVRIRIQTQIVNDFQLPMPTQTQVCDWIEDFQVFAIALQEIADHIAQEADEITDQFHTWLTD